MFSKFLSACSSVLLLDFFFTLLVLFLDCFVLFSLLLHVVLAIDVETNPGPPTKICPACNELVHFHEFMSFISWLVYVVMFAWYVWYAVVVVAVDTKFHL